MKTLSPRAYRSALTRLEHRLKELQETDIEGAPPQGWPLRLVHLGYALAAIQHAAELMPAIRVPRKRPTVTLSLEEVPVEVESRAGNTGRHWTRPTADVIAARRQDLMDAVSLYPGRLALDYSKLVYGKPTNAQHAAVGKDLLALYESGELARVRLTKHNKYRQKWAYWLASDVTTPAQAERVEV